LLNQSWKAGSFELLERNTGCIAYSAAIVVNEQNFDIVNVAGLLEEGPEYVTE
jgi:hypothetical protein